MPIVLPRTEWSRLQRSCARGGDAEAERKTQYVQYLDQASNSMTKSWPNSLENVNRRNEEARAARLRTAELANELFYADYVKRQRDEQTRLMERARDRLFKDKDAPKTLLTAVLECAVQKERAVQLEFGNMLKHEHDEQEREYSEYVTAEARRWLEQKKNKIKARFLCNEKCQREISKQIKECSERNRMEREENIRLEQEDNEKANKQMADIKAFEEKFKMDLRARIKSDMELASREVAQRQREEDEREVLDEKLRQVYLQYKHRVDCLRAHTEKELQKERLRVLEQISNKLQSGTAERDRKENEILDHAVRERDEKLATRQEADRLKTAGFVKDRQEQRRKFLEDEQRRYHEEYTMKAWSLLNRYKNDDLTKEFEQKEREEKWRRTLEHRGDLLRLRKERSDREASEHAAWQYFHGELAEQRLREADQKLLRHADLLRREAEEDGRPTFPLDRAIEMYKRKYELYPARHLPASQQEHYPGYAPEDRTGCDGGVKVQPPRGQPLVEQRMTNGLQDREALMRKATKLESIKDDSYRRQGKGNGLQERSAKTECGLTLPAISCSQVKLHDCQCK